MAGLPHDHHGIALPAKLDGVLLHLAHKRAGGIDQVEAALHSLLDELGAGAVAADDDGAAARLVEVGGLENALLCEAGHHQGVVDEGAQGVNGLGRALAAQCQLQRAVDAVAGSRFLGHSDDHLASRYLGSTCP